MNATGKVVISESESGRYSVSFFEAPGRRGCFTSATGLYRDLPTALVKARKFTPNAGVYELRQLDGTRIEILRADGFTWN